MLNELVNNEQLAQFLGSFHEFERLFSSTWRYFSLRYNENAHEIEDLENFKTPRIGGLGACLESVYGNLIALNL